ncbi:MAG: HepT-like ribonuclease domain-containing protein [Patescibacteria group bacterium]
MKHELQNKIRLFKKYLDKLLPYTALSDEVLLDERNAEKLHTAERLFQLLVDEAIDINTLLIEQKTDATPDTYRGTFQELPSLGVLDRVFANKLSDSVRVRNHIVHEYEDLKLSELIGYIKQYSEMYKDYLKAIITQTL